MKLKKIFLYVGILCFIAGLCGCSSPKSNRPLKFTTSCYPVYIITRNLTQGIENVEVSKMSESHSGCLHDFQLQSDDLKNIELSTAFIINGAGMEPFMDKVTSEAPKLKIIDSSKGVELIKDCDDCHDENCEHEECHHEFNPHIWISLENYKNQIENITEGLISVDPSHEEKYRENSRNYINKINALENEMHSELDGIKNKNIITFHNAFPYFANEFGFNILNSINRDGSGSPSAKELSEISELMKKDNISVIFTEPQYSDVSAKTLAQETGAKIYTLDPAVTGDDSLDSYINIMKNNMKVLKNALK